MKILYFNWVDYLDAENRGGGVTVYQRNVMAALEAHDDIDAYFISAGLSYDLFSTTPRWEKLRPERKDEKTHRFSIVNSGVYAPGHASFENYKAQISHPETEDVFFDFIEKHGPFDTIHFNNLEGIPARVLKLKQRWPQTRVVFSVHNYYPFCSQVNLWQLERAHCDDYRDGQACIDCLPTRIHGESARLAHGVAYLLRKFNLKPRTRIFNAAFHRVLRIVPRILRLARAAKGAIVKPADPMMEPLPHSNKLNRVSAPAAGYRTRRASFVQLINENCDHVLAVSDRVRLIAEKFGVQDAILQTSYIGTQQSQRFTETAPKAQICQTPGQLTLGYLGYMRRDKGFFFLLQALSALPADLARHIRLVVAAPRGAQDAMSALHGLADHLQEVIYADGYSHDDLDEILSDVDLGVVPVLWEDNLPQVAIEMHARRIPLLTSHRGGAQELGNCPDLVFAAGDTAHFERCLRLALHEEIDLEQYWAQARAPQDMAGHIEHLLEIYAS